MRRKIAVLAGGTGSIKLVRGLSKLRNVDLSVISNVGDNIWLHGLYICPDIDTALYGLSSTLDKTRGWGVKDDTYNCLTVAKRLGLDSWFSLGDKDLALHIVRTEMLRRGLTLAKVTDLLRIQLDIKSKVIPSTNNHVPTIIGTPHGKMHLQEYWVKNLARPKVTSISFDSIENARATPQALRAIKNADLIYIAPGNPVTSIGPILALSEISDALKRKRRSVIAVSPIIGNAAFSGPAVKYMQVFDIEPSASGIAKYYSDIAASIIISRSDESLIDRIKSYSVEPILADITMSNDKQESALAKQILKMQESK